jgi:hypothetical protein
MGLMDKVKAQATQAVQTASEKAQEGRSAGQAKLEAMQAKRRAETQLHQLGLAVYAERTGKPGDASEIDRLVGELKSYEDEYGPLPSD